MNRQKDFIILFSVQMYILYRVGYVPKQMFTWSGELHFVMYTSCMQCTKQFDFWKHISIQ